MSNNLRNTAIEDFDWESYEKGNNQSNMAKYDKISEYVQGIAIVERRKKYGAIMIGGKEIIQPIYEELTSFENGIAKAKYSYKAQDKVVTEERNINLSGQVEVLLNNEPIFLPDEYDWGFDFNSEVCIVIKNSRYGLIDKNFKRLLECNYISFDGFKNGYGLFDNTNKPVIINHAGFISFYVQEKFPNGYMCVADTNEDPKLLGIIDPEMRLITSTKYHKITDLNAKYFAVSLVDDNDNLSVLGLDGSIVREFQASSISSVNDLFIVVNRKNKTNNNEETSIYNNEFQLLLTISQEFYFSKSDTEELTFVLDDHKYLLTVNGDLYLGGKRVQYGSSAWDYRWETLNPRKIIPEYLNYHHQPLSDEYEIILDENYNKGISDLLGNVIIKPQYKYIDYVSVNKFIVANTISEEPNLIFGVIDDQNNFIIPLKYNYLLPINEKFVAYTNDKKFSVTPQNEYYKLDLPSFNSHYSNIYFGILGILGNIVTEAIYSTITALGKEGDNFVVGLQNDPWLKYGLIDSNGSYILNPCYDKINYNYEHDYFTTNLSYSESGSYPCENLTNNVSVEGYYIVSDDKSNTILVPTSIADWCSPFSEEGIATLIKDGIKAHLNKNIRIVSLHEDKYVEIPEQYNYSCDFKCGYAPVQKQSGYGIINSSFEEIIPCSYSYIEPLTSAFFKFKEGKKWGIVDAQNLIKKEAIYSKLNSEADRFIKFTIPLTTPAINNLSPTSTCGILDENLHLIIPANYNDLTILQIEDKVYWIATCGTNTYSTSYGVNGLFNDKGQLIIPLIFNEIIQKGRFFICNKYGDWHNYDRKLLYSLTYTFSGEQVLYINYNSKLIIPAQYDVAHYANSGIVRVLKDGKWGLIKSNGDEIIPPSFSFIDTFDETFSIVGISEESKINYTLEDRWFFKEIKYGLIDTTGEIVLPIEYERIEKWDNGYYLIKKDGLYGILSPSLTILIEPTLESIEKLDNRFLIVKAGSNCYRTWYKLIDYQGNEIIKEDERHSGFQKIETINESYFKVYYHIGDMSGSSTIGILNGRGKILNICDDCDDLQYIGNGRFIVTRFEYTNMDGDGHKVYNIANVHWEELFEYNYRTIEEQKNGNFLIQNSRGWGLADSFGKIIIEPCYLKKLVFENGEASIKVKGSNGINKINQFGQIVIEDEGKKILVPTSYYWASSFVNGVSIVRSVHREGIGIINKDCQTIIRALYDSIQILSDNTIRVKEDDCYGIYNLDGSCIFPTIFTTIEYIDVDRIRVVWNLNIATEWKLGTYVKGQSEYKYVSSSPKDAVNNRSAICDSHGNILNDSSIIIVGKYKGKYARAYKEATIEDYKVGIIDIDGQIIIPTEYDGIIIYEHQFARLKKGDQIGIANLKTKEVHMFDVKIKRVWDFDNYGRMIYSEDAHYDEDEEKWVGTKGVASIDGIIIKPGEYKSFSLLDNGLIEITDDNDKIGLIDIHGGIIQSPSYSYIFFNGQYGSVCIGGQRNTEYPYNHIGGKWGIIDIHGKIIKECKYDQEQELPSSELIDDNCDDDIVFDDPKVIASDSVPKSSNSNYYNDYYNDYDDDYDDGYSKYGGYNGYDDQTIDDAFDGDPSLTWNID